MKFSWCKQVIQACEVEFSNVKLDNIKAWMNEGV
jgi:hypothetical protein